MVRRVVQDGRSGGQVMLPPGLAAAPALDLMCTRFVLALAQQQGAQFNLRRDLAGLLQAHGRSAVGLAGDERNGDRGRREEARAGLVVGLGEKGGSCHGRGALSQAQGPQRLQGLRGEGRTQGALTPASCPRSCRR